MFGFFKKKEEEKKEEKKRNYDFDDDDRLHAITVKQMNRQIRQMQLEMERLRMKAELDELKDELYGPQEPSDDNEKNIADQLLVNLMSPILAKNQSVSQNPQVMTEQNSNISELSDDDIRKFIKSQDKKNISLAKSMPKTMVQRYIQQKISLSNEEFERAYKILQEEF